MSDTFIMLAAGPDSEFAQREAAARRVANALYDLEKNYGDYLKNARNKDEFNDRLSLVLNEEDDSSLGELAIEEIAEVIKTLADEFEHALGHEEGDEDSVIDDDLDLSFDDDDEGEGDCGHDHDHDHDDDDDLFKHAAEGIDGFNEQPLLDDWPLEPNIVDEAFDGDQNDLESSNQPLKTSATPPPSYGYGSSRLDYKVPDPYPFRFDHVKPGTDLEMYRGHELSKYLDKKMPGVFDNVEPIPAPPEGEKFIPGRPQPTPAPEPAKKWWQPKSKIGSTGFPVVPRLAQSSVPGIDPALDPSTVLEDANTPTAPAVDRDITQIPGKVGRSLPKVPRNAPKA